MLIFSLDVEPSIDTHILCVLFQEYQLNRSDAGVVGQRFPGYGDYQGMGLRTQFPAERKWALGLQVRL